MHGDLDKRFNGGQRKGAAHGGKGNNGGGGVGVGSLSNMARNSASSTRNLADSTVASASVQKVLQIAGPKYKTQLCHYFTAGYCYDEEMCPYAHGDDELEAALANRLPQQLVFNASPAASQSPSEVLMKSTPLPGNLFEGQNCWSVTSVTSPANEEWLPSGSQGKVLSADPDDSRQVIVLFETPGGEVFRVRMPTSLVQKSKPVLPGECILNEDCFYVDNDGAVPFGSAAIIVGPWDAAALLNGGNFSTNMVSVRMLDTEKLYNLELFQIQKSEPIFAGEFNLGETVYALDEIKFSDALVPAGCVGIVAAPKRYNLHSQTISVDFDLENKFSSRFEVPPELIRHEKRSTSDRSDEEELAQGTDSNFQEPTKLSATEESHKEHTSPVSVQSVPSGVEDDAFKVLPSKFIGGDDFLKAMKGSAQPILAESRGTAKGCFFYDEGAAMGSSEEEQVAPPVPPTTEVDADDAVTAGGMRLLTPGDILGEANVPKLQMAGQRADDKSEDAAALKQLLLEALEDDAYLSILHVGFTQAGQV